MLTVIGQRPSLGRGSLPPQSPHPPSEGDCQFGEKGTVRDYVHVADIASGILAALLNTVGQANVTTSGPAQAEQPGGTGGVASVIRGRRTEDEYPSSTVPQFRRTGQRPQQPQADGGNRLEVLCPF